MPIFVDLCSIFKAGAVRNGPGPNFGRKPAQNRPKLKSSFLFPNISPRQLSTLDLVYEIETPSHRVETLTGSIPMLVAVQFGREMQRWIRSPFWADLREDDMINPAPGFWPIFGPLGPTAGVTATRCTRRPTSGYAGLRVAVQNTSGATISKFKEAQLFGVGT